MSSIAYIGLGSNLEEPVEQLQGAIAALNQNSEIEVTAVSHFYRNPPMGPQDQPDYVNAAVEVKVELGPYELLRVMQSIEDDHGRVRQGERWGPRTLDLDLLLYGEEFLDDPRLTIPHPGISKRPFVLKPLADISPDLVIPGLGSIENLLEDCDTFWLEALDGE